MSDLDGNLKVLTDHLRGLAAKQAEAGGNIKAAQRAVEGLSGRMWQSHGIICARSNMAVSDAESKRMAAVKKQSAISDQLGERLGWAASNYEIADEQNSQSIAACAV